MTLTIGGYSMTLNVEPSTVKTRDNPLTPQDEEHQTHKILFNAEVLPAR